MPKIISTSQNTAKQKYANYLTKLIIFMIVSGIIMMVLASVYYSHFNKSPNITPVSYPKQSLQDLQSQGIFADKVYVKKSTRTLQLLNNNQILRQYHIVLGDNPQGHKQQEGDERTPEGWYTLDWANEQSAAYRSLHVSYPNSKDRANAKMLGVSPGGAIMIHGQMNGTELLTAFNQKRDWTNGCIAVTNSEMDEIMTLVKVGTPIFIEW